MASVYIKTLGCKVNTCDSHALANQLKAFGHTILESQSEAEITIINTCCVTAQADKEARYLTRRFRRESPTTFLVVTGCYAQTDAESLSKMEEINLVLPNSVKVDAAKFIHEAFTDGTLPEKSESSRKQFKPTETLFDRTDSNRTRAFVKIQDGCNNFCTYCIVPYARGASISVPTEKAVTEMVRLVKQGTQEIVLTGVHIGGYGVDLKEYKESKQPFVDFLSQVFETKIPRLRISSIEIEDVSAEFLDLVKANSEQFCDHFHLPLQSGTDKILSAMRRGYTTEDFKTKVASVREKFPSANIGVDVIVGFPGESDQDFEETVTFIKEFGVNYLHVFPYSKREGTPAAKMEDQVDAKVAKSRAATLRGLSEELAKEYAESFIGKTLSVLFENETDKQGRRIGHTKNYLTVVSSKSSSGESHNCKITKSSIDGVLESENF